MRNFGWFAQASTYRNFCSLATLMAASFVAVLLAKRIVFESGRVKYYYQPSRGYSFLCSLYSAIAIIELLVVANQIGMLNDVSHQLLALLLAWALSLGLLLMAGECTPSRP